MKSHFLTVKVYKTVLVVGAIDGELRLATTSVWDLRLEPSLLGLATYGHDVPLRDRISMTASRDTVVFFR